MTMIERVARIICREAHMLQPDVIAHGPGIWREGELDAKVDAYWPKWAPAARAALEAMREPSPGMVEAGEAAGWDQGNHMPAFKAIPSAYQAMINKALEGE